MDTASCNILVDIFAMSADLIDTFLVNVPNIPIEESTVFLNENGCSILDVIYKCAMIVIGACNILFAFFLFAYNRKKDNEKEMKAGRKAILNEFVLKHKLPILYKTFEDLISEASVLLKNNGVNIEDKKIILDDKFQDIFASFRASFIEIVGAVDNGLYQKIKTEMDKLQGILSENLFDDGVNLDVENKYKELIKDPVYNSQRKILSILCNY